MYVLCAFQRANIVLRAALTAEIETRRFHAVAATFFFQSAAPGSHSGGTCGNAPGAVAVIFVIWKRRVVDSFFFLMRVMAVVEAILARALVAWGKG